MDFALLNSELIWIVLALVAGGLATGFLAGMLGIGGGGILVPVLFETFGFLHVPNDIRMQMVLGTSFAVIVPTALSRALSCCGCAPQCGQLCAGTGEVSGWPATTSNSPTRSMSRSISSCRSASPAATSPPTSNRR